jgi:ABC-type hemin transport system substrate-binding protein
VGGPIGLDLQRIRDLAPDLVLACKEENAKAEVEALRAAGLRVYVTSPSSVSHVPALLRDLGALLGVEEAAGQAAEAVEAAAAVAEESVSSSPPTRVTCPVWLSPPRTLGRGTYGADLIRLAGGAVEPGLDGYPALDPEEIDPEVLLLPDEPHPFAADDVSALGLAGSTAARTGRAHLVDGRLLFWYGPRTAGAIAAVAELLSGAIRDDR